ncbi:hypothetical protein [Klebsiella variicola]|uniref:hypothetical protein n=1 Tax=Klebsiella variicola TaxID=244366 RepID=UPI0034DF81AC
MKRRLLLQTLFCGINLLSFPSASRATLLRKIDSANDLIITLPRYEGELVVLKGYHQHINLGGGQFIARKVNEVTDYGIVFNTTSELSWCRVDAGKHLIEPEWFGCVGDGITDDSVAFIKMLEALKDGDTIVLRQNASYFNAVPTKNSRFIVKNNDIKIIGNGARIFRRSTSIETKLKDVGNLATLKITGNNASIIGDLTISGGEYNAPLMNRFNFSVSQERFIRGFSSSHALFVENVDGLYLSPDLKCNNAIFPLYIYKSKNLNINGVYTNSGQVYPVKGKDLQLGSCVKIARSSSFKVNVVTKHSAYCGLEIEPYCENGDVTVSATDCFMHGCIVHQYSKNIKVNIKLAGSNKGAGLRISSGSQNVFGIVNATECMNAVLIVSKNNSICQNINLNIEAFNINGDALLIYNDDKSSASLINGKISFLNSSQEGYLINISNCANVNIILDKSKYSNFNVNEQRIVNCSDTHVLLSEVK